MSRVRLEDMNHEPSTSSMATTMIENTRGLTYSVARVIEVTNGNLSKLFVIVA